jgi:hypothetical protein
MLENTFDAARIARENNSRQSLDERVTALQGALPVWARHAAVACRDGAVVITLDDECSAGKKKIGELEIDLATRFPGPLSIERTLRYTHIYGLVEAVVGADPDLRIKLDRNAPLVYVIVPSATYPRSEDLRARIEAGCGLRTCLVLSDPNHRPVVLLPKPSDEAVQATIEKSQLRLLRRHIAAVVPDTWRASIEVSAGGVTVLYNSILRSCQEENRVRAKIEELTKFPVRIAPLTRRDNLEDALRTTVPEGIEVWRTSFYRVNLQGEDYRCALVQVHIPSGRDREALAWRLGLEERFGVQLILQPERASFSLGRQLAQIADKDGLIRVVEPVRALKTNFHGRVPQPEGPALNPSPLGQVMDLRAIPFVMYDSEATHDPEDALFAERLSDGSYRLFVAFADASRSVPPTSKLARYARRAAYSLYHDRATVPMLGGAHTWDDLALRVGQERLAWTVEILINPKGKIAHYDFYRAVIKVAVAYTHADFGAAPSGPDPRADPMFEPLERVAAILERRWAGFRGLLSGEPETPSHRIVEACMVAARERIAHFFVARGIAVPFRVHGPPGRRQRSQFVEAARALGVAAEHDDFITPQRFAGLLSRIEGHPDGRHLFHEILDAHLNRARFSRHRGPHVGAKCEQYTEIKGLRTYAGLLTQWQADHYFAMGKPLFSHAAMDREVRHLNRKSRSFPQQMQRLAMLQRIEERLEDARSPLEAIVEEDRSGKLVLYVPALATIGVPWSFDPGAIRPGDRTTVVLAGYHVRSGRYGFSPFPIPGSFFPR